MRIAQNDATLMLLNYAPFCRRRPIRFTGGQPGVLGTDSASHKVMVQTLGELLKFVVKSRLPIEQIKQSITSLSRAVGIRLAAAEWSSVDLS